MCATELQDVRSAFGRDRLTAAGRAAVLTCTVGLGGARRFDRRAAGACDPADLAAAGVTTGCVDPLAAGWVEPLAAELAWRLAGAALAALAALAVPEPPAPAVATPSRASTIATITPLAASQPRGPLRLCRHREKRAASCLRLLLPRRKRTLDLRKM